MGSLPPNKPLVTCSGHGVDVDDADVLTYRSVMDQIIAALIGVVAGTCAGYGISAYKRRNKIKAGKDPSL